MHEYIHTGEEIKHGCEVLPRPGDFLDDLFSHFSSDDSSVIPNASETFNKNVYSSFKYDIMFYLR